MAAIKIQSNPEQGAEREIDPEIVQEVENSRFGALIEYPESGTGEKIDILLVAAGLKPASDIRLVIKDENGMTGNKFELDKAEIEKNLSLLKKLGLFCTPGKIKIEKSKWKKGYKKKVTKSKEIEILIGHTQKDLDELVRVWGVGDDRAIGLAMGFPPTAVEAYSAKNKTKSKLLPIKKLPEGLTQQEQETMAFNFCRLSSDNWREELEQMQSRVDFIKRVSPKLYGKIIERAK